MDFRILDLFCGAGGFSYGTHYNERFKTVVALDIDAHAAQTFQRNMPDTCVIVGDITLDETKRRVIEESRARSVNMIIGGPPCQGFSLKGKKLGMQDPRNYLFKEYLYFVEVLKPEVFVIENVKAILSTAGGWFRDEILSYIRLLGYDVSYGVLNSKRFGVPQARERAFFICSRSKHIALPQGSDMIVTVREAIGDLAYLASGEGDFISDYRFAPQSEYQAMMRNNSAKLYNHKASRHSQEAINKLMMIPAECGKEYLPDELKGRQRFNTTWGRLKWDSVSPTVDTRFDTPSNGTNSHPTLHRAITPREAARLQSFDDRFVFVGGKFYIRSQIGNAVPPLLAKAVADAIDIAYNGEKDFNIGSIAFENSLPLDFKKENGIFYTDIPLARTIVDFLNVPLNATVLDPWCGTGAFIMALRDRGVSRVYGADNHAEAVVMCKALTKKSEIFNLDSLGPSGVTTLEAMKIEPVDFVISNPPYVPHINRRRCSTDKAFNRLVSDSGNNLFVASLYRAFELCRHGGIVSLIVPKNMLHIPSYSALRRFLLRNSSILSIIELGIHFKTVRGEQIVLTFQKTEPEAGHNIRFYSHNKGHVTPLSEIPQSLYDDEIIVFASNEEPQIYSSLRQLRPLLGDICTESIRRGRMKGDIIKGKNIRKFGLRDWQYKRIGGVLFIQNIFSAESGIIAARGGEYNAGETVTIVNVGTSRMAAYVLGLLHSRLINYYLIRFIFNDSRLTIHTDAQYLNQLPIIFNEKYAPKITRIVDELESIEYMSPRWLSCYEKLNESVYKIYSLSDTEKQYIEREMSKISSSKWYSQS